MSVCSRTILMICPDFPYPPTMGSQIDMWGHIEFFRAEGWRVVLAVCLTPDMLANRGAAAPAFPLELECHVMARNQRWSSIEPTDVVERLQALVEKHRPSIIWCEYADFAGLAAALRRNGAALWFRPVNFEFAHGFEKSVHGNAWTRPIQQTANLLRILRTESRMCRIADRLLHISLADMKAMRRLYGGHVRRSWVLPFISASPVPVKRDKAILDIVYPGSDFSNNVNLAGARRLLGHIVPAANRHMPGKFLFHITGRNARIALGQHGESNVVVHDFVDDFRSFLAGMDIACLPVELGWGCKIKMAEALAVGLPVAGAAQTFRGVPPREDAYLLCRSPGDYCRALHRLLDWTERERVSKTAAAAYESWRRESARILRDALDEIEREVVTT